MRRRLISPEHLESRKLLTAAFINEILIDELFGGFYDEQYVELRGAPSSQLPSGTYLVVADGSKSIGQEGKIQNIFDLSNLSFGNNGFMVLQPHNSKFTANPNANILKSTASGFDGLPGSRYSDVNVFEGYLHLRQSTFFLIRTDIRPNLNDDIDANSDGLIDPAGVAASWTILDSISVMDSSANGIAYGKIAFVSSSPTNVPQVTAAPGTTIVRPNGLGYVGRIGNSVGHKAADWVGGHVRDLTGDEYFVRLGGDLFGMPAPVFMHGRELDHLGKENFSASAHIQIFDDLNDDGLMDQGENPLPGIRIHVETDGNNQRNQLETVIEPDDFVSSRELNNLTPLVTIGVADSSNRLVSTNRIESKVDDIRSTGSRVFSNWAFAYFNSSDRFRADFYRPAQSVSIDFIGESDLTPTIGRLEVFDAAGNSLRMQRTGGLRWNQVQRLSIEMPTDNIAYAVAYSEDTFSSSSPFGRLDRFAFSIPEPFAVTDAAGFASFNTIDPGSYFSRVEQASLGDYLLKVPDFAVSPSENFTMQVPADLNVAPQFEDLTLSIPESAVADATAGNIVAKDRSDQTITYALVGSSSQFKVNAVSGNVQLKSGVTLDFESQSSYVIRVSATDDAPKPLKRERDFTISVSDVNESPVISNRQFSIAEDPALGAIIGTVTATDVDAGVNGQLKYRLINALPENPVGIDEVSGQLTVLNPNYFDFEARNGFNVTVEAFDGGEPSLAKRATITVQISNVNEPHEIVTESLAIGELAVFGDLAGQVLILDPDINDSYNFGWAEGFNSDEFEIDPTTGNISLKNGINLSFARQPTHTVWVTAIDKALPPFVSTREITINVLDENNPPVISDVALSIAENSTVGTVVGTVTATDEDADQTLSYFLQGNTSQFTIEETTGVVRVKQGANLNFELQASHEIVVLVVDSATPSASARRTLAVTVQDVNEPPTVVTSQLSAAESLASNGQIGQIVFGDPDGADKPRIELVDATTLFELDSITGVLRLQSNARLDFEAVNQHVLNVRVRDGVNEPVTRQVTVSVLDSNDAPTDQGVLSPLSIIAGNEIKFVIPLNAAADQDVGQSISYSVTGLPAWLKYDVATRTLSGVPWNPNVGVTQITVVATDNGSPSLSIGIPLQVSVDQNTHPWHNPIRPQDANADGRVTAADALLIIRYLNTQRGGAVPLNATSRPGYLDVNRDNRISATDALNVIGFLNRGRNGEGESSEQEDRGNVADLAIFELWEQDLKRTKRLR